MQFEFATAGRILFGPGTIQSVASEVLSIGGAALVVRGSSPERAEPALSRMVQAGAAFREFVVSGEPDIQTIVRGAELARSCGCKSVAAIGGGSVIDAGKAIAAMATNPGDLFDYLEVVGKGLPLVNRPVPCIAAPTTAGTGAEVTRNSVIGCPEQRVKVSMRSPMMLPTLAVVDPEMTLLMPPEVTASTGLDALTQLLEVFVSAKANPMTDGVCREGLQRAARSLRRAYENGDDMAAREDMALASLFGGLALANAKLGAVHGFAGPLGGMFPAPHGVICARLLPHVMAANVRVLQASGDSKKAARFDEAARILTGRTDAVAADGVAWIQELCAVLRVPSLREYGLEEAEFGAVAEQSKKSSSMQGNPVDLSQEELVKILALSV